MKYLKSIIVMLILISLSGCLSSEQTETTTNEEESKEINDSQILETFLNQLDTEPLEADVYYVFIINENYEIVKTYIFYEKGKKQLSWDGKYEDGSLCPDGIYHIIVYNKNELSKLLKHIRVYSSGEEAQGKKAK